MKAQRPTQSIRTLSHNGRAFVVQKALKAAQGRPRTNSSPRYRVFELHECETGAFLCLTWIGSVPKMSIVKALIANHIKARSLYENSRNQTN